MKKQFRITLNGKSYEVVAELLDDNEGAHAAHPTRRPAVRSSGAKSVTGPAQRSAPSTGGPGVISSPLAGKVVSIDVSIDQEVKAGQQVVTLEAMKMNTVVSAPADGLVASINVHAGDAVEEGQPLLTLK